MIFNTALFSVLIPFWLVNLFCFLVSLLITIVGIPSVIRIAKSKNLYNMPGERTSHDHPVPRLGGTIVFAGIILPVIIFSGENLPYELNNAIAGMVILFFIGIKDDVVSLVPYKKAVGQFLAACILVLPGNAIIIFFDFPGRFENLDTVANVILSIFFIMALINSINFVDGIDGLASGVGILVSLILGIWFNFYSLFSYSVLCFSIIGALCTFTYYNVFSKKNKIFLGDTGSMLIGFLLSVLVIRFLNMSQTCISTVCNSDFAIPFAFALLFVPVFDSIRICLIRMYNGKSIFRADSNHVHHKVLKLTSSHLKASLIILSVNIAVISYTYLLRDLGSFFLIASLIIFGTIFSILLGRF